MGSSIKTALFRTIVVVTVVTVSVVWGQETWLDNPLIQQLLLLLSEEDEESVRLRNERRRQWELERECKDRQHTSFITDPRDGKRYLTARIGNRTWMAENLNFETDNSWCYDNDESNCQKYGRLYSWRAAPTVCPPGWRLPRGEDLDDLIQAVGGSRHSAGGRLKSKTGWNGTDEYCFSALPGGFMGRRSRGSGDRSFHDIGINGYWWTGIEGYDCWAYNYVMWRTSNIVGLRVCELAFVASSVRCVKN